MKAIKKSIEQLNKGEIIIKSMDELKDLEND